MNTTVDEEIAQNNKIIAEFMGFKELRGIYNGRGKTYDYTLPDKFELIKEVETTIESVWCEVLEYQDFCFIEDLKFHSDWNWLMEVVERIRKYHNGTEPLNNEQIGQLAQLIKKLNESLTLRNEVSKEAVYNACVEFIKWYNRQKSAENN